MSASISNTISTVHSAAIIRALSSLGIALAVTVCLFWFMQNLIESADRSLDHEAVTSILEFVRIERDETINKPPIKKPEPPDKPEQQPPRPPMSKLENPNVTTIAVKVAPQPVSTKLSFKGTYNMGNEGDYLPIVKVSPIYPNRALSRGIEGFCIVQYTVTRLGTIKDPVVISDQCTSALFHSSSINAALKFKYKPRVVDGVEVEVAGVRNKFTFEITE